MCIDTRVVKTTGCRKGLFVKKENLDYKINIAACLLVGTTADSVMVIASLSIAIAGICCVCCPLLSLGWCGFLSGGTTACMSLFEKKKEKAREGREWGKRRC